MATDDNGIRVKIGEGTTWQIDTWTDNGTFQMALEAGQQYLITIEYYEVDSVAGFSLEWVSQYQVRGVVSTSQLYPIEVPAAVADTDTGLNATYYNNIDLNPADLIMAHIDPTVSFDWGGEAPAEGVNYDDFSVRWQGYIQPRYTDTYTFVATADNGIRVKIGDGTTWQIDT